MQRGAYQMGPSQMPPNGMMMNSIPPNTGTPPLQHSNYGMQGQMPIHGQPPGGMGPQHQMGQQINLESKIHDMNRRLCFFHTANIPEQDWAAWWNAFAFEFFDDLAKIQLHLYDENLPPQKYIFGRAIIPKFFKALFEGGIREMYIAPRMPCREGISNNYPLIFLDCDNALLHTKHERPAMLDVQTDIRFLMEFSLDMSGYRIRNWTLELKHCYYFNWKDQNQKNDNMILDKLKLGFAHLGLNQHALNTIKMASILEPMQILFSIHKTQGIQPKECVGHAVMQYHLKTQQNQRIQEQRMAQQRAGMAGPYGPGTLPPHMMMGMRPEETAPPPKKTRKRNKRNATASSGGATNTDPSESSSKKKSDGGSNSVKNTPINNNLIPATTPNGSQMPQAPYNDLMVVGEPTVMGGDYGSGDERKISRVENNPININDPSHQQQPISNQPMMQQNFQGMPNQQQSGSPQSQQQNLFN
uniref:LIM domain-binding protein 2 (inferred by orthology to a human protein) n=1 Tax=Strongyloides venezuelensis TaxID=75913 RepID=A0A0K0FY79_STRVS